MTAKDIKSIVHKMNVKVDAIRPLLVSELGSGERFNSLQRGDSRMNIESQRVRMMRFPRGEKREERVVDGDVRMIKEVKKDTRRNRMKRVRDE